MSHPDVMRITVSVESLSSELRKTAEALIDELFAGPFLPIFERHEIERLVCSPTFRSFLESEHNVRTRRMAACGTPLGVVRGRA